MIFLHAPSASVLALAFSLKQPNIAIKPGSLYTFFDQIQSAMGCRKGIPSSEKKTLFIINESIWGGKSAEGVSAHNQGEWATTFDYDREEVKDL